MVLSSYEPGTICWAKLKGYPWWPSRVSASSEPVVRAPHGTVPWGCGGGKRAFLWPVGGPCSRADPSTNRALLDFRVRTLLTVFVSANWQM
ncbi:hypothetical protein IWW55_006040 [Coemansia sp. RSA 2706]|nr:hypothetical protein IWW55_006040 [Coemansia sp. RSA 2706]